MSFDRQPFSPDFDFVWLQPPTLFDGRTDIQRGDVVDKSRLNGRVLASLYETRKIDVAGFGEQAPAYLKNGEGLADKLEAERVAREAAEKRASKEAKRADAAEARANRAETIIRAATKPEPAKPAAKKAAPAKSAARKPAVAAPAA